MDTVTVVIYSDPTSNGLKLVDVYKHYSDAELFVHRQSNPHDYQLSQKVIKLNG